MDIELKELKKKDHKKVIQYAIKGMHFNMYMDNKILLNLYGRYFWYLEYTNATQIISAYMGDELAGVLIADIKDEKKKYKSFLKSLYVRFVEFIQKHFFKDSVGIYDEVNKEMLKNYRENNNPNGEIRFLAVNPEIKGKGIGSIILEEFEKREKGKQVYLFTDDQCTYQFYEHKGFDKVGEKDIVLDLNNKKVPLKCFLYSKII